MAKKSSRSKIVIIFIVVILLAISSIYIFIPSTLQISKINYLNVTHGGAIRTIANMNKWREWWPQKSTKEPPFVYNNLSYIPYKTDIDLAGIIIRTNHDSVYSTIAALPVNKDSTVLQWKCALETGNNPITRIQKYFEAQQIKNNMTQLFDQLEKYLENENNVYGVKIQQSMVTDTVLITTTKNTQTYPQPADINLLISKLRNYAASQGVTEQNHPMLNIKSNDSTGYQSMVALSISKTVKETNDIKLRRMVPGKILITEIKGGRHAIDEGFQQLEYYLHDHRLIPPAKPFESLVTDRAKETDTSKWITKIYYPVM